jgi:hypothetical protein
MIAKANRHDVAGYFTGTVRDIQSEILKAPSGEHGLLAEPATLIKSSPLGVAVAGSDPGESATATNRRGPTFDGSVTTEPLRALKSVAV